jgi:hypothetical protein
VQFTTNHWNTTALYEYDKLLYRSTIKRNFHYIPKGKKIEDLHIKLSNDGFLYSALNVKQTPTPNTRHGLMGWVRV